MHLIGTCGADRIALGTHSVRIGAPDAGLDPLSPCVTSTEFADRWNAPATPTGAKTSPFRTTGRSRLARVHALPHSDGNTGLGHQPELPTRILRSTRRHAGSAPGCHSSCKRGPRDFSDGRRFIQGVPKRRSGMRSLRLGRLRTSPQRQWCPYAACQHAPPGELMPTSRPSRLT
jgi:hypothetical protein